MLGDSLRRRGTRPAPEREARPEPNGRRRFRWWHWVLAALTIVLGAFITGYLLSVLVLFPAPETAGAGIPVPDLRGQTRGEARTTLSEAALEMGRVLELPSMDVDDGQVLAQDPVPGQQLRRGGTVDLTLSGGPPELRVPPVEGLGLTTARDLLRRSGFGVEVQQMPGNLPEGAVIRMSPAAGSELRLPAVVILFVSTGPASIADSMPPQPLQPQPVQPGATDGGPSGDVEPNNVEPGDDGSGYDR